MSEPFLLLVVSVYVAMRQENWGRGSGADESDRRDRFHRAAGERGRVRMEDVEQDVRVLWVRDFQLLALGYFEEPSGRGLVG